MRALLIATLLIVVVFLIWVYPNGVPRFWESRQPAAEVGTSGAVDKARERGAELGEKTAIVAAKAQETVEEAATTAKIKAKMALDETVKARTIDVSTSHSTVTLSGTVGSEAERDRAVALARETAGVTEVVDHLTVRR